MINVFVGNKTKQISFKVAENVKGEIEKRALELGFTKTTDYILTLIDKDFRERENQ